MRIDPVPAERVTSVWDRVRPGVEVIARKCPDYWRAEDVYAALVGGRASLFLVDHGFFVAERFIEPFTKTPIFNVWLMWFPGATRLDDELMAQIDVLARGYGCVKVRFVSPRPWEAILKGKFQVKGVIFERNL